MPLTQTDIGLVAFLPPPIVSNVRIEPTPPSLKIRGVATLSDKVCYVYVIINSGTETATLKFPTPIAPFETKISINGVISELQFSGDLSVNPNQTIIWKEVYQCT